ncbi:MAG: glucose dehydrogenase [bacterium]|nr:glucose dehydrogenase [bacterium]
MMSQLRIEVVAVVFLTCLPPAESVPAQTPLTTVEIADGLQSPVLLTFAPGDTSRLFVVEQSGSIRLIKSGVTQSTPFLDIRSRVSSGGERGLLGLAFHPRYSENGFFYVYYTASSPTGQTTVSRFSVSGTNLDSATSSSEQIVLSTHQPEGNHNGGMIAFGPNDSLLYIGLGDGGGGGDPNNLAQTPDTLLGKMLRIDVDAGTPYAVPPDNPFVGANDTLPEIWAIGLRNPWRWSFDRATGDMWIADVGQGVWEEIDFQPVSSSGGENYGWRLKEGDHCYNPSSGCDPSGALDDPIYEYRHETGPFGFRCSVTGGFVYRGCAVPDLRGAYFFAEYCSGEIWSFRYDGSSLTDFQDRTTELTGGSTYQISAFGEDANGELYILEYDALDGKVHKIVPDGVPDQCSSEACCQGPTVGDVNQSGGVDITDISVMIDNQFLTLAPLPCDEEADVDFSGLVDITDLSILIDNQFLTLTPLPACA